MEHHAAESKIAKHVLTQPAVGSSMAFSHQYSDAGLFGVYGSCVPAESTNYIKAVHSAMMAPLTAADITRAKNTLKRVASESVSTGEELVDDIGHQMVMSGSALSAEQIAAKIDAVTEAQVKACQGYVQACKPTVVAYGQTGYMPHYDEVCDIFKGAAQIPEPAKKIESPKAAPAAEKKEAPKKK